MRMMMTSALTLRTLEQACIASELVAVVHLPLSYSKPGSPLVLPLASTCCGLHDMSNDLAQACPYLHVEVICYQDMPHRLGDRCLQLVVLQPATLCNDGPGSAQVWRLYTYSMSLLTSIPTSWSGVQSRHASQALRQVSATSLQHTALIV